MVIKTRFAVVAVDSEPSAVPTSMKRFTQAALRARHIRNGAESVPIVFH